MLYTFFLCKATLKTIAKQMSEGVPIIFKELDQNNHKYLAKKDFKLILSQLNIKYKEEDLLLLMNHLGNG